VLAHDRAGRVTLAWQVFAGGSRTLQATACPQADLAALLGPAAPSRLEHDLTSESVATAA
jgi:hypothetical protein